MRGANLEQATFWREGVDAPVVLTPARKRRAQLSQHAAAQSLWRIPEATGASSNNPNRLSARMLAALPFASRALHAVAYTRRLSARSPCHEHVAKA